MDQDTIGVVISFTFLISVLIATKILLHWLPGISPEVVRKFLHITVSNWWFILLFCFETFQAKVIPPAAFVVVNSLATFLDWARLLGMHDRQRNYGLIYFPISLVVLLIFGEREIASPFATGVGALVMGYGDGSAAIIGRTWGRRQIHPLLGSKTYLGTLSMLVVSFIVICLFSIGYETEWLTCPIGWFAAMSTAVFATFLELVTPFGLDNLSVPIGTCLFADAADALVHRH